MKTQLQMKNPLINLPFIITDEGEYITETVAIMMYLGDKFGFNGKTPMEKVRISEMMMKLYDFRNAFKDNVMMTPKGGKKEAFATRGVHTFLNVSKNRSRFTLMNTFVQAESRLPIFVFSRCLTKLFVVVHLFWKSIH